MKRLTKQQRETRDKKALSRRVRDIYAGAWGREITEDDFCTADDLSRILPALKGAFHERNEHRDYLWALPNLGNYDRPGSATEFLYTHGVRA